MKRVYTTKEVAEILGVSDRSVRRYLKSFVSYENKGFKVTEKMLEVLKKEYSIGQETDTPGQYDIIEGFSSEEYQEFQKRLIEYPILKQELEYHKKSAESHQRQMEMIIRSMQERNLLEASNNPNFIDKK